MRNWGSKHLSQQDREANGFGNGGFPGLECALENFFGATEDRKLVGQLLVDGGSRGGREGLEPVADFGLDGCESVESFVESETGDSLKLADPPVGWFVGVVQEGIEGLISLEAEELGFGDLAAAKVPPAAADFFE